MVYIFSPFCFLFEKASLGDWASLITAIIALFTAIFGINQIRIIRKQNSISNIMELEKSLLQSQRYLNEYSFSLNQSIDKNGKLKINKIEKKLILLIKAEWDNYFQILDRICFCFLHNYIPDNEINDDYYYIIKKIFEEELNNLEITHFHNNLIAYYNKKVKKNSPPPL